MIIVFTEAVLRYGPPPDFYTVVFGSRSGALDSNALHKRLGQALDGVLGGGDGFAGRSSKIFFGRNFSGQKSFCRKKFGRAGFRLL